MKTGQITGQITKWPKKQVNKNKQNIILRHGRLHSAACIHENYIKKVCMKW